MRVVLDTNILISGLVRHSTPPGRIVSAWREAQFELAISAPMIEELRRVLHYPKIHKLFVTAGLSDDSLEDFLDMLRMKAVVVDITTVILPVEPRDVHDRPVIATMVAAEAEWLVTGDKRDLLSLGLRNIVTARDFLSRAEALRLPPLAEQPRAAYRVARARRKRPAAIAQA